jgi:hypothetical protein
MELAALDVAELLRFLREWQPPPGDAFTTPSRDGLAEVLRTMVAKNPEPYGACAADFRDLDIAYLHGLLMGLDGATRAARAFSWESVLALSQWVLQQHDDPEVEQHTRRDWARVRAVCVGLLDVGLGDGPCELPIATRQTVWRLIAILASDPDPTPEREQKNITDPVSLAINSTRGRALHASARYGVWVRRHAPTQPSTFADLPELRSILEYQRSALSMANTS